MLKFKYLVFFCFLLQGCGCLQRKHDLQKYVKPKEYSGIMKSKFIDSLDRGSAKLVLNNGDVVYIYAYEMYDELQPGDTVIKKAGSLKYILKRNGETKVFYPKFDGKEIK